MENEPKSRKSDGILSAIIAAHYDSDLKGMTFSFLFVPNTAEPAEVVTSLLQYLQSMAQRKVKEEAKNN